MKPEFLYQTQTGIGQGVMSVTFHSSTTSGCLKQLEKTYQHLNADCQDRSRMHSLYDSTRQGSPEYWDNQTLIKNKV